MIRVSAAPHTDTEVILYVVSESATVIVNEEVHKFHKELLGVDIKEIKFADIEDIANKMLEGLRRVTQKYGVKLPIY